MTDWLFQAPANLKDFRNPFDWHNAMAGQASDIVKILVASVLTDQTGEEVSADKVTEEDIRKIGPTLSYANPVVEQPPQDAQTIAVQAWGGFPRAVERRVPWTDLKPIDGDMDGTLRAVQHLGDEDLCGLDGEPKRAVFVDRYDNLLHLPVRDRQDEYLEWVAETDADGNLTKITFVAEGYDYFTTLFEKDEGRCLELYRDFTGLSSLKVDDLRAPNGIYRRSRDGTTITIAEPGTFNPRNRYNINPGIVHLSHAANSLGAEVNLAGVSAIARKKLNGTLVDGKGAEELLCCNQGGNPNRNSDPLISQQAYAQVLGKYRYTLSDPVGLYIAGADDQGLLFADNTPVPREWWNVVRGRDLWDPENSRVLRLELRPPTGEKRMLSDLFASGAPLRYPGQIAKLLSVHLFVTRWQRSDGTIGPEVSCIGTCCRLTGKDRLERRQGIACSAGFELAFPGLVKDQAMAAPLVMNQLSRAHGLG